MRRCLVGFAVLLGGLGCSAHADSTSGATDGSGATSGTGAPGGAQTGSSASGAGPTSGTGGSAGAMTGTGTTAGSSSASGGAGPTAQGQIGVWENVTPAGVDPSFFSSPDGFGLGSIAADPGHPTDMYVGGYGEIWKSTDYGLTWTTLPSEPTPGYEPLGQVIAVAGTNPATVWVANEYGGPGELVYKSTDAGLTFTLTGSVTGGGAVSFYSLVVDPYDTNHLLSGLHEDDKILESTDAGVTWSYVSGAGWPSGGISWLPHFVDTGNAATTRTTWFAIAQDGGSGAMTSDGGKTWTVPNGMNGTTHPHGSNGFFQNGDALFVPSEQGVFRSTDLGAHWTNVAGAAGAVWGSSKNVYAMWGWACSACGLMDGGPQYQQAVLPGDASAWAAGTVPAAITWGPNSVATTSDGTHAIFVASMFASDSGAGLWRYIEP